MLKRLLFVLASGVVLVVLAIVGVAGVTRLEGPMVQPTLAALEAGAQKLDVVLRRHGEDLPGAAAQLAAADANVATDMKQLVTSLGFARPGRTTPAPLQGRIDGLAKKLQTRLDIFRTANPDADGVVVASEAGVVLLSDSPHWKVGATLEGAGERTGPFDAVEALSPQRGSVLHDGAVYAWGSAPVLLRDGKPAGLLVIEEKLEAMPEAPGVESALLHGEQALFGKAPAGIDTKAAKLGEAFPLAVRPVGARLFGLDVGIGPWGVDDRHAGVWGVVTQGPAGTRILVSSDLSPALSDLATAQVRIAFLALLVWLLHGAAIVFFGRRLGDALNRMADFLGALHQGKAADSKLNERDYPGELLRLVRLVNKTIEQGGPAPRVTVPPKAPSLDEVIQAQAVPSAIDHADFEFEGITNGGSVTTQVDNPLAAHTPFAPPPAIEDSAALDGELPSFSGDPEDVPPALERTNVFKLAEVPPIPELPEGLDDLEQVEPEPEPVPGAASPFTALRGAVAASPVPQAPAGPVMQMSPGLMAELQAMAGEVSEAGARASPGPAAEAAAASGNGGVDLAEYRSVYEEFVSTRKTCGEPGELSFDKFKQRLDESRNAVIAKHGCKDVKFQVYVKNGKAALKATPGK